MKNDQTLTTDAQIWRDASRYRWFRKHQTTFAYEHPPEVFDDIVDTLMAEEQDDLVQSDQTQTTNRLREFIGCDADYEIFRDIEYRATEESKLSPQRLRVLGVYDVNILLRLVTRLAHEDR